ncbi:MAG: bifunctional folylpolyglutamate synthase/dihydrofolate synthase [Candidatus Kapaibacteriota bacterium]
MNESSEQSSIQELLDFLFSLHRFGIKPGLERIVSLLESLGNPQESLTCIHVAGTNGKGSVCSLLAAILQSAGFRVGLYTSPHIRVFNERIRVNGELISDADIALLAGRMMDEIKKEHTTFFEVTTAMAFTYFAEKGVDIAIIETGMGGRLDATNVLKQPLATVITSIDYDHMEFLGNDLKTIAGEKAGIFKKGSPIIIGEEREVLIEFFKQKASDIEAGLVSVVNEECSFMNLAMNLDCTMKLDCSVCGNILRDIYSDRVGIHQARNILTTLLTLKAIEPFFQIDEQAIHDGIAQCSVMTGVEGRIQCLRKDPPLILDVGHNTACLLRLRETLNACGYKDQKWEIVFGVMKDKPIEEMLEILSPMSDTMHCCAPNMDRALTSEMLHAQAIKHGINAMPHPSVEDAIHQAMESGNRVLITGSFYLADEAMQALEKRGYVNRKDHLPEVE